MLRISVVIALVLAAGLAHAEKSKVLVLPLPAGSAIDRDAARAFDARLLVALEATGKVATMTPSEEPECTTLPCLAALGASEGAAQVLSMSVVRERAGVTLFGVLIDAKSAATARRAELPGQSAASLATTAPAELARQLAGVPRGPTVLGVARPAALAGRAVADSVASRLAALRTFTVVVVDGDASQLTHRADVAVTELAIVRKRHHVRHYLDGVLVATLSIVDLADRRVLFTKTVKVTASERQRYSSTAEVTAQLVERAVNEWMTAFRTSAIEPRLRGGTTP